MTADEERSLRDEVAGCRFKTHLWNDAIATLRTIESLIEKAPTKEPKRLAGECLKRIGDALEKARGKKDS